MNSAASFPRPRWYGPAIAAAVVVIAALSGAAVLVDDDAADGVFGFFTGASCMLLVCVVLWTEIGRKLMARRRDAAALDDLEPLRVATDDDGTDQR